ncbi:hypothetical protein ABE66_04810 [Cytobacillus firmus]|nr:hypothetical protein [Cytobacillus firmus]
MFAHLKSIRDWYSMKRAVHQQITKSSMIALFCFLVILVYNLPNAVFFLGKVTSPSSEAKCRGIT